MNMEERIRILHDRIKNACLKANRTTDEIEIVAVTKTVDIEDIEKAYNLGFRDFGENRVQEAVNKIQGLSHLREAKWHLVGHLQKNKVKHAVKLFSMIQSVDNQELADEISKRVSNNIDVLVEVNTSLEPQKHGVHLNGVFSLVEHILTLENLNLKGFMTVGPYPVIEDKSRKAFSLLREIKEKAEMEFKKRFPVLSMGMTEDFEYAILEGSTMVRIGRAIFGERLL